MKVAAVDIGSNTTLLLIAEKTKTGFKVLEDKIYFTRLIEGFNKNKKISEQALLRLEEAFKDIQSCLKNNPVEKISLVATSASRQAQNQEQLFALAHRYDFHNLEVISSKREAELTFVGAQWKLPQTFQNPLVIDIGGGSTEITSLHKKISIKIGSVSLTENFLHHEILSLNEKQKLEQAIQKELKPYETFLTSSFDSIVFTAGTAVTLGFLETQSDTEDQVHGLCLNQNKLDFWLQKLSQMNLKQKEQLKHLPVHRRDVVVAGLSILQQVLIATGRQDFIISSTGLRYALILESFF